MSKPSAWGSGYELGRDVDVDGRSSSEAATKATTMLGRRPRGMDKMVLNIWRYAAMPEKGVWGKYLATTQGEEKEI